MTRKEAASHLKYQRSPRGKAARTRYRLSIKGQAAARPASAKRMATRKRSRVGASRNLKQAYEKWYWKSPRGRATQRRYHATAKYKATRARYYQRVLKPRRDGVKLCR